MNDKFYDKIRGYLEEKFKFEGELKYEEATAYIYCLFIIEQRTQECRMMKKSRRMSDDYSS
jgi:hypothetical protein